MRSQWELDAAARRAQGEALVRKETGKGVGEFTSAQLRYIMADTRWRPANYSRQEKQTLIEYVQRYVMSPEYGPGILEGLRKFT